MWAIIGGSGFEKFDGFEVIESLATKTPFGEASSGLKRVRVGKHECLFLSRHGSHHEMLPSEVNYRANIFALKKFGAKGILSFSAVGSLRAEFKPGDMVVPNQYVDRTKGVRAHSFCGQGVVGHMSLAKPTCEASTELLVGLLKGSTWDCHYKKTYVCIEGPNFSTIAESHSYRTLGADIIGMTNFPEYALAREAGLCYVPCCFVTDYDCWDQSRPHVTLDEVLTVMRKNNAKAFQVAEKILATPASQFKPCHCAEEGLRTGLMSPWEVISPQQKQWLEVLRG